MLKADRQLQAAVFPKEPDLPLLAGLGAKTQRANSIEAERGLTEGGAGPGEP